MTFGPKERKEARKLAAAEHPNFRYATWEEVAELQGTLSQVLDALEEAQPQAAYWKDAHGAALVHAEKAEREIFRLQAALVDQARLYSGLSKPEDRARAEAAEARVRALEKDRDDWKDACELGQDLDGPTEMLQSLLQAERDQLRADLLRERERVKWLEGALKQLRNGAHVWHRNTPDKIRNVDHDANKCQRDSCGIANAALSHPKEVKP